MFSVLIACDCPDMIERVAATLRFEWPSGVYRPCDSGMAAAEAARAGGLDLIVLDLGLRSQDALAVIECRSTVPILAIDGDSRGNDWEHGVALGTDEYVARPFSPIELLARTKAVVGRRGRGESGVDWPGLPNIDFQSGDAIEQIRALTASACLTWPELRLLRRLVLANGRVVPVRMLAALLWDHDQQATAYARVYVRRLREKIELDPDSPRYLVTERGVGYRFVPPGPNR